MSDESQGKQEHAHYWFMVPKDPKATYFSFALKYRDVSMSVRVEDDDDSIQDLKDLLRSVPVVCDRARQEMQVQRAVGEMEADLNDLLEEDE